VNGVLATVLTIVWVLLPVCETSAQTPRRPAGRASIAKRLQPADLEYLGAFRLPELTTDVPAVWDWSGQAMTYLPTGDPDGADDGFPGSLFATGLDTENWVSEISIPTPSLTRRVQDLPVATTLQPFADIRQGLFSGFVELPRVGLQYLPAQQGQAEDKLHLAWGQHFQDEAGVSLAPTHGWCDLDLNRPDIQGPWWVGTADENALDGFTYAVNGYLMAIPLSWAEANTNGRSLATGRFRDGGWSGMGPSLIAIAPWLDGEPPGSPPSPNAELSATILLRYSTIQSGQPYRLRNYSAADAWEGGAWIEVDGRSAVVFAGTKAEGYTWYGFQTPNGVAPAPAYEGLAPCIYEAGGIMCTRPDGETPCTIEDLAPCQGATIDEASRGWWASRFDAVLLFYDPADLAAVAAGRLAPHESQPYATHDLDDHLFLPNLPPDIAVYNGRADQRLNRLAEPAYDREHGLLYLPEPFADDARPVVHVWGLGQARLTDEHVPLN